MPGVEEGQAARLKGRAATASLVTNCTLTGLKLIAVALTGSVALFSEASHSAADVVSSALVFISVRAAQAPPDEEHPYGHGKIESLAGFGESILLMAIMAYVVFESVHALIHPRPIGFPEVGLAVMGFSAVVSLIIGNYIHSVGVRTGSLALKTDGRHLAYDFVTSSGVLIALFLNHYWQIHRADPIMALILAAWIGWNSWVMAHEAFDELIDRRVPDEELKQIEAAIAEDPRILSYHKLRTRHSGSEHYVELHIVVPRDWSLVQAHEVADCLEKRIESLLRPAQVVVHVDPYDPSRTT